MAFQNQQNIQVVKKLQFKNALVKPSHFLKKNHEFESKNQPQTKICLFSDMTENL